MAGRSPFLDSPSDFAWFIGSIISEHILSDHHFLIRFFHDRRVEVEDHGSVSGVVQPSGSSSWVQRTGSVVLVPSDGIGSFEFALCLPSSPALPLPTPPVVPVPVAEVLAKKNSSQPQEKEKQNSPKETSRRNRNRNSHSCCSYFFCQPSNSQRFCFPANVAASRSTP